MSNIAFFHMIDFVAVLILLPAEIEVLHISDAISSSRLRWRERERETEVKSPLYLINLPFCRIGMSSFD